MNKYDAIIIGGGPAGLACAIRAHNNNLKVLILEREAHLGGILKQCIHDGFGLERFKEKLSGPEYAYRFIDEVKKLNIEYKTEAFVTKIDKEDNNYILFVVTKDGIIEYLAPKLVLSTGCRERTSKQVGIHGTRPKGVYTAGAVQHLVNIDGIIPSKDCVILGSGDIGLIMARRLTLEGTNVKGVYEIMPTPSGLTRNIHQCLKDYNIPLHLSTTVTRCIGDLNLEAVEICKVDESLKPIKGTEEIISCDTLIVSVGLIPENELASSLGVKLDPHAKGATCDLDFETNIDGVYTCGNATHVNDLVDYVSESGEIVGDALVSRRGQRELINIELKGNVAYLVPEMININVDNSSRIMYFRSNKVLKNVNASLLIDGIEVFNKTYANLRPPEMQRIVVDFPKMNKESVVIFEIKGGQTK